MKCVDPFSEGEPRKCQRQEWGTNEGSEEVEGLGFLQQ